MKMSEFLDNKMKEGKVVFCTIEGLAECPIEDFINQPVDGLLYDLNRGREVVLTMLDKEEGKEDKDMKWINDFAVSMVITRLKEKLDDASKEMKIVTDFLKPNFSNDMKWSDEIIIAIQHKIEQGKDRTT